MHLLHEVLELSLVDIKTFVRIFLYYLGLCLVINIVAVLIVVRLAIVGVNASTTSILEARFTCINVSSCRLGLRIDLLFLLMHIA